jgi:hypothetical protein
MMIPHQQLILRVTDSISQHIRSTIAKQADKETNIIVEIESELDAEGKDDFFIFSFNGNKYPALLLNLPTLVETQKTFDRKIFYKSGDIGQMLHVFDTANAREQVKTKQTKIRNGEVYYINGLTPPTSNIIKNRYELTSKSTDNYPVHKVKSVINDIASAWNIQEEKSSSSGSGLASGGGAGGSEVATGSEYLDIITEEVVDFQEWMVANNTDASNTSVSLLEPPHTNKNGLVGLACHIDGNEWNNSKTLGVVMEHPEILEAPNEENIFIFR